MLVFVVYDDVRILLDKMLKRLAIAMSSCLWQCQSFLFHGTQFIKAKSKLKKKLKPNLKTRIFTFFVCKGIQFFAFTL